jgi:hypothetical protein
MIAQSVSHDRDLLFPEILTGTVLPGAGTYEKGGAEAMFIQPGDDRRHMGLQPVVETQAHGSVEVPVPRRDPGLFAGNLCRRRQEKQRGGDQKKSLRDGVGHFDQIFD